MCRDQNFSDMERSDFQMSPCGTDQTSNRWHHFIFVLVGIDAVGHVSQLEKQQTESSMTELSMYNPLIAHVLFYSASLQQRMTNTPLPHIDL